ncbi:hypothetical protein B472_15855 [Limnohabitans sp. Rim28]|nr:hypothetical protein B472_15855 [Limnohabitans sp. Rim28]
MDSFALLFAALLVGFAGGRARALGRLGWVALGGVEVSVWDHVVLGQNAVKSRETAQKIQCFEARFGDMVKKGGCMG